MRVLVDRERSQAAKSEPSAGWLGTAVGSVRHKKPEIE